jgi:hypothetical protein
LASRIRAVSFARPKNIIFAGLAAVSLIGDPGAAAARGKPRDCKPNGQPVAIGGQGAIEVAEAVEYEGQNRILAADKAVKPSKLHVISPSGEAFDLPNPPWTMEPTRWLSRGHAVYAVGTGRSQTQGKTDVVLVRWGTDSRPRLTKIATPESLASPPRAALVGEFMAVMWAEAGEGGKLVARASFIDIEELKVGEPKDLGAYSKGAFTDIGTLGKGFVALWGSDKGLMRAAFDVRGKATAPAAVLEREGSAAIRSAITCGEQLWVTHDGKDGKLAVSTSASGAPLQQVALLDSSDNERAPLICADDNVIAAHRTINAKANNVVFWISTIEPSGKVRERRVKDMAGTADTIRMPLLAATATGDARSAFWVEGGGADAKLWSREIVCE